MEDIEASQAFGPYLMAGERILWSGQPKQGLVWSGKDVLLVPFSLLWGGFAIFWNAAVWFMPNANAHGTSPDWFFKLWGLPFLAIGVYIIAGRFFHDAHIRRRTRYAVTNQRILTLRDAKVSSLDVHRLPRLELAEHGDGTGTLAFEAGGIGSFGAMNGLGWWLPAIASASQFYRIANPRAVYGLIQNAARA